MKLRSAKKIITSHSRITSSNQGSFDECSQTVSDLLSERFGKSNIGLSEEDCNCIISKLKITAYTPTTFLDELFRQVTPQGFHTSIVYRTLRRYAQNKQLQLRVEAILKEHTHLMDEIRDKGMFARHIGDAISMTRSYKSKMKTPTALQIVNFIQNNYGRPQSNVTTRNRDKSCVPEQSTCNYAKRAKRIVANSQASQPTCILKKNITFEERAGDKLKKWSLDKITDELETSYAQLSPEKAAEFRRRFREAVRRRIRRSGDS